MEAKLYRTLYRHVYSVAHPRRRRVQYDDRWIALVFLWSVLHDRPRYWACEPGNWPRDLDRPLPDESALGRRLRTVGVQQLVERVTLAASDLFPVPLVKAMDSKPLTVGGCSTDRDARRGRVAAGQFGRGYRLHAVTHGRLVRHWTLLPPLNEHDSVAAPALLPRLDGGGGYVVADNAYDTNGCHGMAAAAGHQLVAPPKACHADVRDPRRNRPERLRALDLLHTPLKRCGLAGDFGRELYNCRQRIESAFGGLTFAGLGPLPPFVRGPRRVAMWTAAKILIYLCRCATAQGLMA